jgi:hypothetical protein
VVHTLNYKPQEEVDLVFVPHDDLRPEEFVLEKEVVAIIDTEQLVNPQEVDIERMTFLKVTSVIFK